METIKPKLRKYRLFFVWQHEEEEQWLNEMSAQGYQLVKVGFCSYLFEQGSPNEYIYRLELLDQLPSHPDSLAYLHFLEETGIEHIGSMLRWVYYRKKADQGAFDLYSDIDSKIRHFNRMRGMLLLVSIVNVPLFISNLSGDMPVFNIVFLLIFVLFLTGVLKISGKIRKLEKEKRLRE